MTRFPILLATFSLFALILSNSYSATSCKQEFHIFGKTPGDTCMLYVSEFRPGCGYDKVTSYHLLDDTVVPFVWESAVGNQDTTWISRFLDLLGTERMVAVKDSLGIFRLEDSISFSLPEKDSTFERRFDDLMGRTGATGYDWLREYKQDCLDEPKFAGVDARLLYRHPRGIYKNYSILLAVWFPDSRYLVLIIHQPKLAAGEDTNHGLLIYRLSHRK